MSLKKKPCPEIYSSIYAHEHVPLQAQTHRREINDLHVGEPDVFISVAVKIEIIYTLHLTFPPSHAHNNKDTTRCICTSNFLYLHHNIDLPRHKLHTS